MPTPNCEKLAKVVLHYLVQPQVSVHARENGLKVSSGGFSEPIDGVQGELSHLANGV